MCPMSTCARESTDEEAGVSKGRSPKETLVVGCELVCFFKLCKGSSLQLEEK